MVMLMFTRFINVRNVINVNNFGAAGSILNVVRHSNVISKPYSTTINSQSDNEIFDDFEKLQNKKINKAMKAYLQRSKDYRTFIEKQILEYDIGKRHLANMMGEDPDKFTQKDVDKAIKYLFPSGLYEKQARPIMKHPDILYDTINTAAFDDCGRPHHFLFYTTKPNYYEVLHKVVESINYLNKIEDHKIHMKLQIYSEQKLILTASTWLTQEEMEKKLQEKLWLPQYEYLITSLERVVDHPVSKHVEPFIMEYRKMLKDVTDSTEIIEPQYDSDNRPFVLVEKCARKSTRGQVKITGNGSGNISINGTDITYFNDMQCREQVIFPLMFTNMADKVDIEATVSGGGPTGQAGAIRWGIAWGLRSFVDVKMIESMRIVNDRNYCPIVTARLLLEH
ncbi:PREDICTED: 28S ribosomal protein S9, mitochondrial [Habropoda laboriosa]|uniref:28S ribosomal protein S9, mitochondrial n=1 Tax=Habropoda laboriosa TaxID=597456 RepID=UPI00083D56FB|nr:PREDICTED: 28S ribosomal protein S9, mitochondrial [Habropoda laboriosa]